MFGGIVHYFISGWVLHWVISVHVFHTHILPTVCENRNLIPVIASCKKMALMSAALLKNTSYGNGSIACGASSWWSHIKRWTHQMLFSRLQQHINKTLKRRKSVLVLVHIVMTVENLMPFQVFQTGGMTECKESG